MHKFKIHFSVPLQELAKSVDCTADVQVNDEDIYQVHNILPNLMEPSMNSAIELKVIDGEDLDIEWVEVTKTGISPSFVFAIGEAIESSLL